MIVQLPFSLDPSLQFANLRSVGSGSSLGTGGAGGNFAEALARAGQDEPVYEQIVDQNNSSDSPFSGGPGMPRLSQQAHAALINAEQTGESSASSANPEAETDTATATGMPATPEWAGNGQQGQEDQGASEAAQTATTAGAASDAPPAGAQSYGQPSGSADMAAQASQAEEQTASGQAAPATMQAATAAGQGGAAAGQAATVAGQGGAAADQVATAAGQGGAAAGQVATAAGQGGAAAGQVAMAARQGGAAADQVAMAAGQGGSSAGQVAMAARQGGAAAGQTATAAGQGATAATQASDTAQVAEGKGKPAQGTLLRNLASSTQNGDQAQPTDQVAAQGLPQQAALRAQPAGVSAKSGIAATERTSSVRRMDENPGSQASVTSAQTLATGAVTPTEAAIQTPADSQADFEQSLTNWLTGTSTGSTKAETRLVFTDPNTPMASAQIRRDGDGTVHISISGASTSLGGDQIDKLRRKLNERGLTTGEISFEASDSLQTPVEGSEPE